MSLLEYLDQLFFGPTHQFVAQSKYSLDESVARLRAALLPKFWRLVLPFRTGLCGTVEPDRVHVKAHQGWRRSGVSWFDGAFSTDRSGVILSGQISVPLLYKLLFLLPIPVVVFEIAWAAQRGARIPAWWITIATAIFVQAVVIVASRLQRGCDERLIADLLDNALS
ncbi:MAG TPA: hypothetical protein VID24_12985 [Candidatus Eremiobacteraceae bacterium]|jgi:hypothetical protein